MDAAARLATRRPAVTAGLVLLAAAYLAPGLRYSATRPVFEGELPETDRTVRETNLFNRLHPDRNFYGILVISDDRAGIWNPRTLGKIVAISREAARLRGALPNVQSLATWQHVAATGDTVSVRPLMAEAPRDGEAVERLRNMVTRDRLLRGRLVSLDGRMAFIRVTFREDAEQADVHAGLESLRRRFAGPERIAIVGRHYLNQEIETALRRHVTTLLPAAIALLLAFQYLCFGRWQAVWALATLVALTVECYLGLVGRLEIPQSVVSSTVPVLLVAVVGSYAMHFLQRLYQEAERQPWQAAVRRALARTAPPIALAAATTAAGFESLVVFRIYSVREFGVLASIGVAIGAVLSLLWLPAALLVFARQPPVELHAGRRRYLAAIDRVLAASASAAGPKRRRARRGAAFLLAAAGIGIVQLRVGSNPWEFFPPGHKVRRAFETLREHFGGDGFFFIDIAAPPRSDIYNPTFLRQVAAFQRDAEGLRQVGYVSSVVDTVITRMNRRLNDDDPASERVPESRALVAQYLELYRWQAPDTLAEMVEDADPPRHLVIDVFADVEDSADIATTVARLRALLESRFRGAERGRAIFGGEWVLWTALNRYIVVGKLASIAVAVGLVGFFCLLVFRSARTAAVAVLPATAATLIVLGVMGAIGIRLDLASCVLTSLVVGIGVDFAVHFLWRHRELAQQGTPRLGSSDIRVEAIRQAGPPILYDAWSNVVAFGVFIVSPLEPVRNFGWLICLSMLSCAIVTLALLPGFLSRLPKRKEGPGR